MILTVTNTWIWGFRFKKIEKNKTNTKSAANTSIQFTAAQCTTLTFSMKYHGEGLLNRDDETQLGHHAVCSTVKYEETAKKSVSF